MAFDWREYLEIARHIGSQMGSGFSEEAAARCAISRAYYAAFCHARNHAQQHSGFIATLGPQDHQSLRQHYRRLGMWAVANDLDRLRQWRNQCDYDNVVTAWPHMLSSALSRAENILKSL